MSHLEISWSLHKVCSLHIGNDLCLLVRRPRSFQGNLWRALVEVFYAYEYILCLSSHLISSTRSTMNNWIPHNCQPKRFAWTRVFACGLIESHDRFLERNQLGFCIWVFLELFIFFPRLSRMILGMLAWTIPFRSMEGSFAISLSCICVCACVVFNLKKDWRFGKRKAQHLSGWDCSIENWSKAQNGFAPLVVRQSLFHLHQFHSSHRFWNSKYKGGDLSWLWIGFFCFYVVVRLVLLSP